MQILLAQGPMRAKNWCWVEQGPTIEGDVPSENEKKREGRKTSGRDTGGHSMSFGWLWG